MDEVDESYKTSKNSFVFILCLRLCGCIAVSLAPTFAFFLLFSRFIEPPFHCLSLAAFPLPNVFRCFSVNHWFHFRLPVSTVAYHYQPINCVEFANLGPPSQDVLCPGHLRAHGRHRVAQHDLR